jgi:hypothetical protein
VAQICEDAKALKGYEAEKKRQAEEAAAAVEKKRREEAAEAERKSKEMDEKFERAKAALAGKELPEHAVRRFQRGDKVRVARWGSNKQYYWEGVITDKDNEGRIEVRIEEIHKGWALQLNASKCSGNIDIESDSRGRRVWIPTWCVQE